MTMTANEWLEHLGEKVDIVEGELVLSPDGFLTVSASLNMNVLLVNKWEDCVTPVVPSTEFRGRSFKYRSKDCAHLYAEWSDRKLGTSLLPVVRSMSRRDYTERTPFHLEDWLLNNGFTKVDEPAYGDLVLLRYVNHVGAYLGDGKVLHHLKDKYSSIDTVELNELQGVYRHAI